MPKKTLSLSDQLDAGIQDLSAIKTGTMSIRELRHTYHAAEVFDASKVKQLRSKLNVSQSVLAFMLRVSPKTVQAWEIGNTSPSGPARVLLELLQKKPLLHKELMLG